MAVEGVNNFNNNNALYAGGAALTAGAAGGAVGYYTKSLLKDGMPTDTFVNKVGNNIAKIYPEEAVSKLKEFATKLGNAQSIEDMKDINLTTIKDLYSGLNLEEAKLGLLNSIPMDEAIGVKPMNPQEIVEAKDFDELMELVSKNIDEKFAGKTLEELKSTSLATQKEQIKNQVKNLLSTVYDFDKNKFYSLKDLGLDNLDAADEMGKLSVKTRNAIVDAARSIKGKAALIYGGISAAVGGIGTFLVLNNKAPQQAQDEETEEV